MDIGLENWLNAQNWEGLDEERGSFSMISPNKYTLLATPLKQAEYPEAARIASLWQTAAQNKANLAATSSEKEKFATCKAISKCVYYSAVHPNENDEIYACKDEKGNIHGFMVLSVESDHVYVNYLVTNPNNIRSSVNENVPKVEGAGTCLLKQAEKIAFEKSKWEGVVLTPVSSAIAFYQKLGFSFDHFLGCRMSKTLAVIASSITPKIEDLAVA